MNGAAISFSSKKHTTTDDSTTAAELTELHLRACDVVDFRELLKEIGLEQQEPTIIFQDNQAAIQISMTEGETIDQMVRRLRGRVVRRASWRTVDGRRTYIPGTYSGGVMTLTTPQAEALARTAAMHVGNQAREAVYAANADLVKGYQRVETLDTKTCLICGVADGQVVKTGESRTMLPAHPNCRGVWVPVLKSWRELGIDADEVAPGTRASMDGQVPEYETWRDLLEKAGPARRVEILGPSRARLYAQGYPLDALVKDGRVVPLAELPKRGAA